NLGGNNATGARGSDVVRLLLADQLPDFGGGVTVNSTGLLDLNGNNETIGTQDGATALTVKGRIVQSSAGTLTVKGDINLDPTQLTAGGLPGAPAVAVAPSISGNVAFPGSISRDIRVTDSPILQADAVVSALLTNNGANADIRTVGSGALVLSGNNSGL